MYSPGKGLPAYFSRAGFGSKLSTWEGPPLRKKWTTRLALPGKGGALGDSGLTLAAARAPGTSKLVSPNKAAKLTAPIPIPHRDRKFRRVRNKSFRVGWWCIKRAADSNLQIEIHSRATAPGHIAPRPSAAFVLRPAARRTLWRRSIAWQIHSRAGLRPAQPCE